MRKQNMKNYGAVTSKYRRNSEAIHEQDVQFSPVLVEKRPSRANEVNGNDVRVGSSTEKSESSNDVLKITITRT